MATFDQVVAEDGVVGEAIGQRALEGIDVVDALADEGAFREGILVQVGNGTGLGIDA